MAMASPMYKLRHEPPTPSDPRAQHELHGKCTQSGWRRAATSATAPNCTYIGSRHWRAPVAPDVPSLIVGSCAKGVRASLEEHSMAWLENLGSTFRADAYGVFVYWDDDGDRDGTQTALRGWARRNRQIHLVLAPPLRAPNWYRTQRLALCRNVLLGEGLLRLPAHGTLPALTLSLSLTLTLT